MTAPPVPYDVATCQRKHRHPDEFTARASAQYCLETHEPNRKSLWVYPCPVCRGWHLTKRRNDVALKVTRDALVLG